jgi:hypothetical protein
MPTRHMPGSPSISRPSRPNAGIKFSSNGWRPLTQQPLRCPLATESDKFPEEPRDLLFGKRKNKYRIILAIRNDDVVLYVHHAARQELEP